MTTGSWQLAPPSDADVIASRHSRPLTISQKILELSRKALNFLRATLKSTGPFRTF